MADYRAVVLIHMANARSDGSGAPPTVSTLRVENHVAPPEPTDLQRRLDEREAELRVVQGELRRLRRRDASRAPRESSRPSSPSPSDGARASQLRNALRRARALEMQAKAAEDALAAAERRAADASARAAKIQKEKEALERVLETIGRSDSSSAGTATSGQRSLKRKDVAMELGDEPLSQRTRLGTLQIPGNEDDAGAGPSRPAP